MYQLPIIAKTSVVAFTLLLSSCSTTDDSTVWQPLLDKNLSQWELWMGVPHKSVKGLPEGTYQAENLRTNIGAGMGLNNDVKQVFSVIEEDEQPVLKITGEIYGGLTTLKNYQNYHFSTQFKWGEQKWAPRLTAKRDSGILFHCRGEHGVFWNVWKACQEFQIQETDIGDYIPLAGPAAKVRSKKMEKLYQYNPDMPPRLTKGYTIANKELDAPHGHWNTLDLYAVNDMAVFVVNNEVVMVIEGSINNAGEKLDSGQIQIQSEGAELYYRQMKIREITRLPKKIQQQAEL
jgi:hypothetical protein